MPSHQASDRTMAGYWYLPATPQHRVGGKLYVQPDGTTVLEVAEKLDVSPGARVQSRSEPVIHGIGTDGTLYSLFNSDLKSSRHGIPPDDKSGSYPDWSEYSQYVWHVSYYTSGAEFIDHNTNIAAIRVSFSVLREWLSVEEALESVLQDRRESRLNIPPERQYASDCNGTTVVLHDHFKASGTRYESSIEYAPYFEVLEPPTTIGEVVPNWVLPLQRLMMFLSSYYAHITTIRIRRHDSQNFLELHLQTPQVTAVNPTTMFLGFYIHRASLQEMEVSLDSILENWLLIERDYPYLSEIVDVLASRQYRYDDIVLLLLFRAVEFFHDNTIGSQTVPHDAHKERVEQITSHLPDATDREWVQSILIGKNRKGQALILREILASCGRVGELISQHHPDFVRNAVKARNRVVHTRRQSERSSEGISTICIGLVWVVRRLVTEKVLGSDQIADDYITNRWVFRSYLGEPES